METVQAMTPDAPGAVGIPERVLALQVLAAKAEAWKVPSGCCEAGFRLSLRGQCRECNAGPDETCRKRWEKPPALFQEALQKDGMALINGLAAENARLREALKLIAIVDQGCGGNLSFREMAESAMQQARAALTPTPAPLLAVGE